MNKIAEEILSYYGVAERIESDTLEHYGIKRRSGRYPYGSGDDPYQHGRDFLGRVEELRKQGFTYVDETGKKWTGDTAIAKSMGLSTNKFRTELGIASEERKMYNIATAKSLRQDGLNTSEIGRKMGVSESTVRGWFKAEDESKFKKSREIAETIRKRVDEVGMVDVGSGVEKELRISKEQLDKSLYLLEREGYPVYSGRIEQVTNRGQWTTQKVICPPGTEHKEIYNLENVHTLKDYISRDGGMTLEKKFNYPSSMDSSRLKIRYAEEGGESKDGIVELRPGKADLSLGESRYSQVRIMVDGKKYIKGMAIYGDPKDFPDGVDVIFNTNKSKSVAKLDVLKDIKNDPDNPFGSLIKDADQGGQYWYDPATGNRVSANDTTVKDKKLGLINKRADEGDWTEWKDKLPAQFLSKQPIQLAKKQLGIAIADKEEEFDAIKSLNNPTVKKHYLQKFADECDSAAVHLQAAALPGQKYHVIIPINSLKDDEIYAPNYKDGTKLALVRYPHGGTFEIPIVTVNNKNKDARKIIGTDSIDAVGITKKVADRLSGADFDGDTVMCIPTNDRAGKVKIASKEPLEGLKGFDPKASYQYDKHTVDENGEDHYYRAGREFKVMKNTGTQMGIISNLITDMTLSGDATDDELAAAVRHSMVVIDAEKHKLDYKQSEIDNNISALHKKYQGRSTGGASTIISKVSGEYDDIKRQGNPIIDPVTGKVSYKVADDAYYEVTKTNPKTGEVTTVTRHKTRKTTKMAATDDAYTLVSEARHPMELLYADYANKMKAMANESRLEMLRTPKLEKSKSAENTYKKEVSSLMSKLNQAELNKGREREAQRRANVAVQYKKSSNPDMKKEDEKKARQQSLTRARQEVGSVSRRDRNINITDKEWEAIQAGAISESKLKRILNNADPDSLRERATPKNSKSVSSGTINRIKAMSASYTIGEIADKLNMSPSTVSKYLKGGN